MGSIHCRLILVSLCLLALLSAFGCGGKNYEPYEDDGVPRADYEGREESRRFKLSRIDSDTSASLAAMHTVPPPLPRMSPEEAMAQEKNYLLGAGDVLEIIYQLKPERSDEPYKLEVSDAFRVSLLYTPNLDAEVTVRPDGKVNLPLVGDVIVAGKSTAQIHDELLALYSKQLRDPVVRVVVTRSNNAIEELKRAITTAPRGQSRLTPVRPDGFISLPLVGDVKAAGRSIPDLSEDIVDRYRAASVRNIDVTVVLLEVKAPVVFLMGEVTRPGPLVLETPTDIWRAVALSGGFLESSNPSEVVLARKVGEKEQRYTLDFRRWASGASPDENVFLKRGDVVYVPKEAGRFVYVMGEVEKPGRVRLEPGEEIRVSQALSLAGRILRSGRRGQVLVLSRENNEPVITAVSFRAILNPRHYQDVGDYPPRDPILKAGDIVYVSPTPIGSFNKFAESWFRDGIWTVFPFIATYNLN